MKKVLGSRTFKIIKNEREDLTSPIDEDVFTRIITGLPFELSTLIWKNVFANNLDIKELISIAGSNDYLDDVISSLLKECYCNLRVAGSEPDSTLCEFEEPIGGYCYLKDILFDKLISFMRNNKVSVLYCDVFHLIDRQGKIFKSTEQFIKRCENVILRDFPKNFNKLAKLGWSSKITFLQEMNPRFFSVRTITKLPCLKRLAIGVDSNSMLIDILKASKELVKLENLSIFTCKNIELEERSSLLLEDVSNLPLEFSLELRSCFKGHVFEDTMIGSSYGVRSCIKNLGLTFRKRPVTNSNCLASLKNLEELKLKFEFGFEAEPTSCHLSLVNNSIRTLSLLNISKDAFFDLKGLKSLSKLTIINSQISIKSFNLFPKSINHLMISSSSILGKGKVNYPVNLRTLVIKNCPDNIRKFPVIGNKNSLNSLTFVQINFESESNCTFDTNSTANNVAKSADCDDFEFEDDCYDEPLSSNLSRQSPDNVTSSLAKAFFESLPECVTDLNMYCESLNSIDFKPLKGVKHFKLSGGQCSAFNLSLLPPNINILNLAVKEINFVINRFPLTLDTLCTTLPVSVLKQCLKHVNLKQLRLISSNTQIDLSKFNFGSLDYFCLIIDIPYVSCAAKVKITDVPETLRRFNVDQKFDLYIPKITPNLKKCGLIQQAHEVHTSGDDIKRARYV